VKSAPLGATILLVLIAVAHILRILFHVEVTADGTRIPMWVSWVAVLVTGILSIALWRESRQGKSG